MTPDEAAIRAAAERALQSTHDKAPDEYEVDLKYMQLMPPMTALALLDALAACRAENERLRVENHQALQTLAALVLQCGGKLFIQHDALVRAPRTPALATYEDPEASGLVMYLRDGNDG